MPSSEAKPDNKPLKKKRSTEMDDIKGVAFQPPDRIHETEKKLKMDHSNVTLIDRDIDVNEINDEDKILLDIMVQLSGLRGCQNIDEAINSLRKIEDHPRALFVRGELYEKGIGSRVHPEKALDYFKKAADKGEPNAKLKLARLFLSNSLTNPDE